MNLFIFIMSYIININNLNLLSYNYLIKEKIIKYFFSLKNISKKLILYITFFYAFVQKCIFNTNLYKSISSNQFFWNCEIRTTFSCQIIIPIGICWIYSYLIIKIKNNQEIIKFTFTNPTI